MTLSIIEAEYIARIQAFKKEISIYNLYTEIIHNPCQGNVVSSSINNIKYLRKFLLF